ncbi:MAG TPA: hypothetical protein DCP50_11860, partial [Exiguobacterium sp.]|nr:hypothetical protein [Exiguobacterium sp.]
MESASSVFILPTFTGKSQIFLLFLYIIFKGDDESLLIIRVKAIKTGNQYISSIVGGKMYGMESSPFCSHHGMVHRSS